MDQRNNQQRVIDGFNAAVEAGWTPPVPEDSRCRKCHRPHLPYAPLCAPYQRIAEEAPAAPETGLA